MICDAFNRIISSFNNLPFIDKLLIIILSVSLLAKLILEIVSYVIQKKYNTDKNYNQPCIYLKIGVVHDCKILKYKEKYLINQECKKRNCPGYRSSTYTLEEIKRLSKFPFLLLTITKWISELSAIVLIIRTILKQ